MSFVGVVAVGLGAVDEVEERLEVRRLLGVDRAERGGTGLVLLQQALADDFFDVCAGELHAGLEAGLDLGEVVALLLGAVADDLVHVLLRGHEYPRAALALGVEALGDRLEVEHQVRVGADELADLVDEEVEPETFGLLVQPSLDLVGEVLDGDGVLVAVLGEDVGRRALALTADFGVGLGDVGLFEDALLAALGPVTAGDALVGLLERLVLAAVVEVALEAGDVALVAVVAAALVEDLDEHLQQGVGLVLGDERRLLVDVEQQALGRDALGLRQQGGQEGASGLGAEALRDLGTIELLALDVAEQVGEHLQQVRLTGAEEAGDPHAVGVGVVRVRLQKQLKALGRLIGEDVLVDLGAQVRNVVRLDDALDRALDVLGEDLVQQHRVTLPVPRCSWLGSTGRPSTARRARARSRGCRTARSGQGRT